MKFGTQLYPLQRFPELPVLVDYVQRCEALGYEYVLVPEHTIFPTEHERTMGSVWWDAIVLAGHLAEATSTIRICFAVLILPQHHPIYLAKQLATLDVISNGRIEAGVGVGWLPEEFEWLGADFSRRGAAVDEYIPLMKALWTTHPSEFESEHFAFSDASFLPKPLQKPHLPIHVAGDPRVSAPRAARLGDGWMPMEPASEFEPNLEIIREILREEGRPIDEFSIFRTLPLFEMSDEAKEHSAQAGAGSAPGIGGSYDEALELVREYEALGVTHTTVTLPPTLEGALEELPAFAEKVIRRL